MINVGLNCMRYFDQSVLKHLEENATNGEIRIVYRQIAEQFQCHPLTALNTVHKLMSAGQIRRVGGNNRTGYVYRINRD